MDDINSITSLISSRENMYMLLARIFLVEVDQAFLDQMALMDFSINVDQPDIAAGYQRMGNYLDRRSSETLTDLAVDFALVFLGAGKLEGNAAYPYESVYTSQEKLIMQEARDQVLKLYREEGLDRSEALDVPEDHIALELEFMSQLCEKTRAALTADDLETAGEYLMKQKNFLALHLRNWIPAFCADVERNSHTDFYQGAARIIRGYLEMEQPLIDQLLEEISVPAA